MKCPLCKTDKLRREFPFEPLTDDCEHAPLHCLQCTTKSVKKNQSCSICNKKVTTENPQYQECINILKRLFPEIEAPQAIPSTTSATLSGNETITVSMMGGETTVIPYDANMTIASLKVKISKCFSTEPQKQRLLCDEKELKVQEDSNLATLQYYGVKPFSTINLIVVLYDIPDDFDEVIFDLFWGYPTSGRDYLDASVLLYSETSFIERVDYGYRQSVTCTAVWHSGDVMDDANRLGHHTIRVKLKSLQSGINRLFFTLSAWASPNISKYPNPSLRFFDARFPKKQLCSTAMDHAAYSQAIIMCSLCKFDGAWKVLGLRRLSRGNAMDYGPLKETILQLITTGLS
ncbi:uncharacterized protein LOC116287540 [Actinia tenebrosa]|uniref:Uncharacterized protein LOC116287540 n=1 Tax=Actinia tenebrosa TaxID=6105 RepID=A0A6P8H112_ACTTE|nr:uncharacterized protein LOC116287540 [Actinia tenebrosa]